MKIFQTFGGYQNSYENIRINYAVNNLKAKSLVFSAMLVFDIFFNNCLLAFMKTNMLIPKASPNQIISRFLNLRERTRLAPKQTEQHVLLLIIFQKEVLSIN